jgi:glucokinase
MTSIGLDVGGTKVLAVAVGEDGRPIAELKRPVARTVDELLDGLAAAATDVAGQAGVPVDAVGVGMPGLVDADGVVRVAPNLRLCEGVDVRSALSERLGGCAVTIDNDVTCAAAGERAIGAAAGHDDVVLVALGTGIGGGLVVDGRIARGANGFAGEVGHVVVDPFGPWCPCGRRGCWERYASGSGLGRLGREAAQAGRLAKGIELAGGDAEGVRGEHVTAAARGGDAQAVAVLEEFSWWLSLGLAGVANVLDPSLIVLGGGLIDDADLWLDAARRSFDEIIVGAGARPAIPVVPAMLGARAGAVGAAHIAQAKKL